MATKARQQYFADEISLQKQRREFSLEDNIKQKIDSVEEGAQVNTIETVKVNGTALTPDANKAVNVEVPDVIDNLYSTSTDDALSAKQGKVLYDYLQNIASRGRFLSNWNCATGLPVTNPTTSPYTYMAGDYYSISNVATGGGTNYRPDGSSYTIGQASTTTETEEVNVSDFYLYDGTNWLLLVNTARQIAVDSSLSTTSTNPVENRVVTNAVNGKADIEYVTQAEYTALLPGAESDGKHYFIYSTSGGGGGWQPGVNTIAYWKLDGDLTDELGNYDGTATGGATITYEALPGDSNVQCVKVNSSGWNDGIGLSSTIWTEWGTQQTSLTFATFMKLTTANSHAFLLYATGDAGWCVTNILYNYQYGLGLGLGNNGENDDNVSYTLNTNTRYSVVWTYDHTTRLKSYYVNGVLVGSVIAQNDYNTNATGTHAYLARINNNTCLSNTVLETNTAWTQQEAELFHDTFKSLYGIS